MEAKSFVTVNGECFTATLLRSGGSYETDRTYEFRLEDLAAQRGTRGLTVVFTRRAVVNAHDFQSREHLLPWNAIRRAFDTGELDFDSWAKDQWTELKIKDADAPGAREPAPDDIVRDYLMAKLYWLGFKYRTYVNPVPTWVDLEPEEDLDYLGAKREDVRRVAWRMEQDGLLQPSGSSGVANPTEKLLKLFEAQPREVVLPPNSQYSSYRELSRILGSADTRLTIVDNYVDGTLLDMLQSTKETIEVNVLTQTPKPDLRLALQKFKAQFNRKVEVRVHKGDVHDRFVIVDGRDFYSSGASLKDAGNKLSVLTKLQDPGAIAHLREQIRGLWDSASPL